MGNLNFPHFQHNQIWKMRKMLKVHAPRIAEICLLGFLHLLFHKKPKRCKIHTPKNLNYQHFRHNRIPIMLIMSIVHNFNNVYDSERINKTFAQRISLLSASQGYCTPILPLHRWHILDTI